MPEENAKFSSAAGAPTLRTYKDTLQDSGGPWPRFRMKKLAGLWEKKNLHVERKYIIKICNFLSRFHGGTFSVSGTIFRIRK